MVIAVLVGIEDSHTRSISNKWSVLLICVGCMVHALAATPIKLSWLPLTHAALLHTPPFSICFCASLTIFLVLSSAEFVLRHITHKANLGMGDIKYLCAWTFILGPVSLILFSLACLCGGLVSLVCHQRSFALGPYLSASFCLWVVMLSLL